MGSNRTAIPNSILAHYVDESSDVEKAERRRKAQQLSARDAEATRALQSKLLEDKIRAEQLAQIDLQRQIKEEELRKEKEADARFIANASAAAALAKAESLAKQQKARDTGAHLIQSSTQARQQQLLREQQEKLSERQRAEAVAMQDQRDRMMKKEYDRQVAISDQRLWDHQKALQGMKNSPTKSLSPREVHRRHVETDQAVMREREEHDRVLDERANDIQRQQEEKVFKQLALINATAEGTVKMLTPRNNVKLQAINSIGTSAGMIDRMTEGDRERLARSEVLKKNDTQHIEERLKNSPPKHNIQNGLHSWGTTGQQLASSPRSDAAAKSFEGTGHTMVDKLTSAAELDASKRKQDGRHIEGIQRIQADQRRLLQENEKGMELQRRLREDMERREQDEALKKQLDSMLNMHGVKANSPRAARLKPIDSPRRNPGPGMYGNYESRASPLNGGK